MITVYRDFPKTRPCKYLLLQKSENWSKIKKLLIFIQKIQKIPYINFLSIEN